MASLPNPLAALEHIRSEVEREVRRGALRARNGIRPAPAPTRWASASHRRTWSGGPGGANCGTTATSTSLSPPLLIVFSLITRSYILDLTRATAS